jgi:replicative DNA helicase
MLNDFENKLFNNNEIKTQNYLAVQNYLTKFFRTKRKSLDPTLSGLASGFYNLDSLTQGFQKSDLIFLLVDLLWEKRL